MATRQKKENAKEVNLGLAEQAQQQKIVFITLQITLLDSVNDSYDLVLKKVLYADGVTKKMNADLQQPEPHYLYCELQNEAGSKIDVVSVFNPLYRIVETSDEHTGRLEKHSITAKTGEFVLRFNLNNDTRHLVIYKRFEQKLKTIYHAKL